MEKSELAIGNVLEVGDTIGTVAKTTKYYTLEGNNGVLPVRKKSAALSFLVCNLCYSSHFYAPFYQKRHF